MELDLKAGLEKQLRLKLGAKFTPEMFKEIQPFLDSRKVKTSLILRRYHELKSSGLNSNESVYECSVEFDCSDWTVKECIYHRRELEVF